MSETIDDITISWPFNVSHTYSLILFSDLRVSGFDNPALRFAVLCHIDTSGAKLPQPSLKTPHH